MELGSLYMYYVRHCVCINFVFSPSGGIELTVFSAYFKVELDVVDIQSQRVDRFGEGLFSYHT